MDLQSAWPASRPNASRSMQVSLLGLWLHKCGDGSMSRKFMFDFCPLLDATVDVEWQGSGANNKTCC